MSGISVPIKNLNPGMHTLDLVSPAREAYLDHVQAAGFHCIRATFIWSDVLDPNNPNANANAWAYAGFVQQCALRNIQCMAVIHTFEAAGAARDQHLRDLTNWVYNNWGPDGSWWGAWGLSPSLGIQIYEIFNEPNDGSYSAAGYGSMVKPAYEDLRCPSGHNDARVRVICGGLRNRNTPEKWLEDLINSGNFYVDHIGVHPYPTSYATVGNANAKAMMTNCAAILSKHSATQQLLITEYAYPYTTEAAQKAGYDDFNSWLTAQANGSVFFSPLRSWFPAINTVAEGFSGTDCRMVTTTDWTSFHDRSIWADFAVGGNLATVIS